MRVHAVVPVKALRQAKMRLAEVLTLEQRARLTVTMLHAVCEALRATLESNHIQGISIVTGDAALVPSDFAHIIDRGLGLNAALAQAAGELSGRGAQALLIVPADLPFVQAPDLRALCAAARPRALAIASDRARCGTNALLLAPPQLIGPQFGPASFAAHAAAGAAAGVAVEVLEGASLACDIDEPADLELLRQREPHTYAFLSPAREPLDS